MLEIFVAWCLVGPVIGGIAISREFRSFEFCVFVSGPSVWIGAITVAGFDFFEYASEWFKN